MGYYFFSPPGSDYGPCESECQHTDCALTRKHAESICPVCGQPIGYDRNFYYMDQELTVLVHTECEEDYRK